MSLTRNIFYFKRADNNNKSVQQTLEQKKQSRQNAKQWPAYEEPLSLKTSVKEFTMVDGNTTSYSTNRIKANAKLRKEQDVELVFKI